MKQMKPCKGCKDHFGGQKVSKFIHELYHTEWSLEDILNITHLEAELQIVHQHFAEPMISERFSIFAE